jgi:oligosaccharide translocation protein RFT1
LFIQNSFKYVLTQGDGLLITALASLRDQGAYALASNYGGLIARMLFQPIEEISRNMFAQLFSKQEGDKEKSEKSVDKARDLLQNILRIYGIIALVACAIGPTAAPILLRLVAGSRWADTEASTVLVSYCYYIPLLAINGVTEAFVASTASEAKLYLQSAMMAVWFVAFAGSTFFFMRVLDTGAVGLVYANCLNMALRILFNFNFIFDEFKSRKTVSQPCCQDLTYIIKAFSIGSSIPHAASISTAVGTWALLQSPILGNTAAGMSLQELLPVASVAGVFLLLL